MKTEKILKIRTLPPILLTQKIKQKVVLRVLINFNFIFRNILIGNNQTPATPDAPTTNNVAPTENPDKPEVNSSPTTPPVPPPPPQHPPLVKKQTSVKMSGKKVGGALKTHKAPSFCSL